MHENELDCRILERVEEKSDYRSHCQGINLWPLVLEWQQNVDKLSQLKWDEALSYACKYDTEYEKSFDDVQRIIEIVCKRPYKNIFTVILICMFIEIIILYSRILGFISDMVCYS